jgi:excisionase family DNA binding protein
MKSEAERRGDALYQLEQLNRCTVPHACVLMQLHHHTLRKYIDQGIIEVLKIGERNWVSREEIDRWNRDHTPSPALEEAKKGGGPGYTAKAPSTF